MRRSRGASSIANLANEVPIEETPGSLSDHYDPRSKSVHLSPEVFRGVSIASTSVAAHEVGHAIQHAQAYAFFRVRSAMFPAVQFASNIWVLFLIGGIFFQITGFVVLAVALYAIAVLFQIVTLPVEFDASEPCKAPAKRARPRRCVRRRGREERAQGCRLDVRRRRARRGRDSPLLPVAAQQQGNSGVGP